jgi:hypothetical protein
VYAFLLFLFKVLFNFKSRNFKTDRRGQEFSGLQKFPNFIMDYLTTISADQGNVSLNDILISE